MAAHQHFIEISALVHPDAVEGISDVFRFLGAKGVADEGTEAQRKVTAYFPQDDQHQERVAAVERRLEDLREAGLEVGVGFVCVREVEEAKWSELWRVHFRSLRITPNLTVVPSWEKYQPQADEQVLVLDPGAAFGTGGHATTRLCLRALAEQVQPGDRVADVGCGSGILAIAAALLGADHVVATDSDPTALPVAQFNAERNRVADRIELIAGDLLTRDLSPFEVIVCNILAPEVIRLSADLPGLLGPGGRFIGSGFVTESIPEVQSALAQAGLEVIGAPQEEEWAAVVAQWPGVRE